jgi:hypothetical protein
MASQTKRTDIVEVAFASALDDGDDVIRIPETLAQLEMQTPVHEEQCPICAARAADPAGLGERIDFAGCADATIALEHLLAKICGLGAQFPLVHAELGAEGVASARDLKRTPAAEAAAVGASRNFPAIDPTAFHGPRGAHISVLTCGVRVGSHVQQEGYKEKHVRGFPELKKRS